MQIGRKVLIEYVVTTNTSDLTFHILLKRLLPTAFENNFLSHADGIHGCNLTWLLVKRKPSYF